MPARFPYKKFEEVQRKNPCWAPWTCVSEVVKPRPGLSKSTIRKAFERLIPEDDYAKSERKQLLDYLFALKD